MPLEEGVTVDLPEIAENGNIVPYKLDVESPMTEDDYVERLHLLSTANPQAAVATFHFTPLSGKATVTGRMRLAKTQDVVAVAETSTGKLLIGTAEHQGHHRRLRKRVTPWQRPRDHASSFPRGASIGEIIEVKALITHVMETGNRKDCRRQADPAQYHPLVHRHLRRQSRVHGRVRLRDLGQPVHRLLHEGAGAGRVRAHLDRRPGQQEPSRKRSLNIVPGPPPG